MAYIIVTSDDLQPQTLSLVEKYWKSLKEKHPNLKVTFFVSPFNQEFGQGEENHICVSNQFKGWWSENKGWCSIVPHGFDHTKPPECQRDKFEQQEIITETKLIFEKHLGLIPKGWKAPFYRMNEKTIDLLRQEGFTWYSQWWNYIPLKVPNRRIPEFVEIATHTNVSEGKNPDNIDQPGVFDLVDSQLTRLENLGFTYSTFDELSEEIYK